MNTVMYQIPNISCGHCVRTVENEVSDLPGVVSVKADEAAKTAEITYQDPASEEKIKSLLAEINYPAAN